MNPILDAIIGGWQINGITTLQSGQASTPRMSPISGPTPVQAATSARIESVLANYRPINVRYRAGSISRPSSSRCLNSAIRVAYPPCPGLVNFDFFDLQGLSILRADRIQFPIFHIFTTLNHPILHPPRYF